MKFPIMDYDQPAGTFFLTVMDGETLIRIARANPRQFDDIELESVGGMQREPSAKRIKEIAEYSNTFDAAFPTPVLLALKESSYTLGQNTIQLEEGVEADIVDGQHRIEGIRQSGRARDFKIPVVLILNPTDEQKALMFAVINGKQTKVPASLVYDLFGVTKGRSPYKTAHEMARALNNMPESPWYRRLKMLGKRTGDSEQSLSQGTFVKHLLPNISNKPDEDRNLIATNQNLPIRDMCIFNQYFRQKEDQIILKLLINVFSAAKLVWRTEWDNPEEYILTKTTGFTGIMRALPSIYSDGKRHGDLSTQYLTSVFHRAKGFIESKGWRLTSEYFPPGASSEGKLAKILSGNIAGL